MRVTIIVEGVVASGKTFVLEVAQHAIAEYFEASTVAVLKESSRVNVVVLDLKTK